MEHKILSTSFVLTAAAILSLSLMSPHKVLGQQYSSNDEKKEISIDKKVRSVDQNDYFDNIESSKKTFYENDVIEFKVTVTNTGNQNLTSINVKDLLPKYLGLIFYPGTINGSEIDWKIDSLNPGESKDYLIRAKIQDTKELNSLTKVTNTAKVNVDNLSDSDNASYFIGKVSVPDTGAGDIAVKTGLVVTLVLTGFALRKLARGY